MFCKPFFFVSPVIHLFRLHRLGIAYSKCMYTIRIIRILIFHSTHTYLVPIRNNVFCTVYQVLLLICKIISKIAVPFNLYIFIKRYVVRIIMFKFTLIQIHSVSSFYLYICVLYKWNYITYFMCMWIVNSYNGCNSVGIIKLSECFLVRDSVVIAVENASQRKRITATWKIKGKLQCFRSTK